MIILKLILYRDGGTIEIQTDRGTYCLDRRINTKTKDRWFLGYPDASGSNMISNSSELEKQLVRALGSFRDQSSEGLRLYLIKFLNQKG